MNRSLIILFVFCIFLPNISASESGDTPTLRFYYVDHLAGERGQVLSIADPNIYPFFQEKIAEQKKKFPLKPRLTWDGGERPEINFYIVCMPEKEKRAMALAVKRRANQVLNETPVKIKMKDPATGDLANISGINIWIYPSDLPGNVRGLGPAEKTEIFPFYDYSHQGIKIFLYPNEAAEASSVKCIFNIYEFRSKLNECLYLIGAIK